MNTELYGWLLDSESNFGEEERYESEEVNSQEDQKPNQKVSRRVQSVEIKGKLERSTIYTPELLEENNWVIEYGQKKFRTVKALPTQTWTFKEIVGETTKSDYMLDLL